MALDLTSPPQAPPRINKAAATRAATSKAKTSEREDGVNGVFQLAGFGCIVAKQYADAGALGKYGPALAHEVALLSEKNEGVAKALDYLTEVGPYAGVITAAMPLVLQLLANHKVLDASKLGGAGVVPPDMLAAEVSRDMAKMQADAIRQAQQAELELAQIQQEQAAFHAPETPEAPSNGDTPTPQPARGRAKS